jgi:hypothetical protein
MHAFRPLLCCLLLLLGLPTLAQAQATRTWVSGVGDDANPCSRTAPCKTFAGAISKTAAGGVISVLDPGGFGAVTITKAITIESDGAIAGVLSSGTNGIIVNAGANDVVQLRRLAIHGGGTGLNGVRFLAGKLLVVESSSIEAVTGNGIDFQPGGDASLRLRDVIIRSIGSPAATEEAGIRVKPGAAGSVSVQMDGVQISAAEVGIALEGPVSGNLRDISIQSSGVDGLYALGTAAAGVDVHIEQASITDSTANGLRATGANTVLRLSNSTLTGNAQGLLAVAGGQILSYGNNRNTGNLANGAPTGTLANQ